MPVAESVVDSLQGSAGNLTHRVIDAWRGGDPPRPPIYRGFPYVSVVVFAAVALVGFYVVSDSFLATALLTSWLYYSIIVVGFYFVFGLSGQFAFSQAGFAGVGAYVAAFGSRVLHEDFLESVLVGVLIAAILALTLALLLRRASQFYFAIATLGFGEVVVLILQQWTAFTGGAGGEVIGISPISLFGHDLTDRYSVFIFFLALITIILLLGSLLERSAFRRDAIAVRDKEIVAATLGLSVLRIRVTAFVLGSTLAAASGAVLVHWQGASAPDAFNVDVALGIFVMLVVGGQRSMWGALVGALVYVYLPELAYTLRDYMEMVYGVMLIVVLLWLPHGLVGLVSKAGLLLRRGRTPSSRPVAASALGTKRTQPDATAAREKPESYAPVVTAQDISVSFGGVRAVRAVTLELRLNEILGIVGPNGSGKSSLLNAMTGVVKATGQMWVLAAPIAFQNSAAVRRRGVLRSFQTPQVFTELTCIENVLLAIDVEGMNGPAAAWLWRPLMLRRERLRWERAAAALEDVGLLDHAELSAASLSYGHQRMLELARLAVASPVAVFLDEPSAGLNQKETTELGDYLLRLRGRGTAILVVDHKVDFITRLCDRIAVMNSGEMLTVGDPDAVFADERVIDAFLGVG